MFFRSQISHELWTYWAVTLSFELDRVILLETNIHSSSIKWSFISISVFPLTTSSACQWSWHVKPEFENLLRSKRPIITSVFLHVFFHLKYEVKIAVLTWIQKCVAIMKTASSISCDGLHLCNTNHPLTPYQLTPAGRLHRHNKLPIQDHSTSYNVSLWLRRSSQSGKYRLMEYWRETTWEREEKKTRGKQNKYTRGISQTGTTDK